MCELRRAGLEYQAIAPMPVFRPTGVRVAFGVALTVLGVAGAVLSHELARVDRVISAISDGQASVERLSDILAAYRDSVSASRGYAPDAMQLQQQSVDGI